MSIFKSFLAAREREREKRHVDGEDIDEHSPSVHDHWISTLGTRSDMALLCLLFGQHTRQAFPIGQVCITTTTQPDPGLGPFCVSGAYLVHSP